MNVKRILASVLTVAMMFSMMSFSAFADEADEWNGTSYDIEWCKSEHTAEGSKGGQTYYIKTAAELAGLAYLVNTWYDVTGEKAWDDYRTNNAFQGDTVILEKDIDLANFPWEPIGSRVHISDKNAFRGNFEGNGHTIKNLYVPGDKYYYAGLFGKIATNNFSQTFRGITIENAEVNSMDETAKNKEGAGALFGDSYGSIIDDCHVTGTIAIKSGDNYAGALCGQSRSKITNSTVTAEGTVEAENNCAGGLVGQIAYSTNNGIETAITSCAVSGSGAGLTVKSDDVYTGGLVGWVPAASVPNLTIDDVSVSDISVEAENSDSGDSVALIAQNFSATNVTITNVETKVSGEASVPADAQATVNGVYFTSFYDAVKNAQSGDEVELLDDVTYDVWKSIWNKDGITINGNNNTVTVNSVDSGVNGGGLLLKASNLVINELNVVLPSAASTPEREKLASMYSGSLNNVTVTGGANAVSVLGEGNVVINDCEFSDLYDWAIETEGRSTSENASLTITNTSFDDRAIIIRGKNTTFNDNTITNAGEGVNVLGDAVIKGNDFGESTLGIDQGREITIENNIINNVEFPNWFGVEDEDYSAMTVESNTLSSEAVEVFNGKLDEEVVSVNPVAKLGDKAYYSLADAVAAAQKDDKIDLLGNVVDLPEVNSLKIKKDISIENGTIDISNGVWNGNSIIEVYGGTSDDFVEVTFNNVNFIGDSYSSAFGVIYAYDYGKVIINKCKFDLSNEKYSAGGVLKGVDIAHSAFDVTDSEFNLENPNRIIANATVNLDGVKINAAVTDDTLTVGEMNNHAFRNLVGTVNNSKITADGFETGIKNTEGNLVISGNSVVTLVNSKDTDLIVGTGKKVEIKDDAQLYADTTDIASDATVDGEGFVDKANKVYVQYRKIDVDANGSDTIEDKDVYEIVLAADAEMINELASADLTFNFNGTPVTGGSMNYTVEPATGVSLTQLGNRFMFNYDGVTKYEESGEAIVIGTITVDGYGSYTLATAETSNNAVYATEIKDNIVDGFTAAGELVINTDMIADDGMVGEIKDGEGVIAVPTRTLTVNVTFPNAVEDNEIAYQNMKVEITGNIDGVNKTVTYNLGEDENAMVDGAYQIKESKLVVNNNYNVTVSGAGYRTARYTVSMTDDKELTFWNNVMDDAKVVETNKPSSEEYKNFLAGDIVKDNNINIYDLSAVVSYFAQDANIANGYAKYDLNRDGVVDSKDVAYVLVSWNN